MGETLLASVTGLTLGLSVGLLILASRIHVALGRTERKVELLVKHAGVDVLKAATDEAQALMRAGKKIDAIRIYREFTGCGLAEAKARVEAMV